MRRGRFSQKWVTQAHVLALALIGATGVVAHALPSQTEPETLLPTWDRTFTIKAAGGYKDNVGLSHAQPEASPFFRSTLEAVAIRLPMDDQQVSLVVSAEDTRYSASKAVDHEDFVVAQGEYRHFWANDWQAALAVQGLYLDQVLDLSVTEARTNAFPVLGGGVTLRPSVRRDLSEAIWLSVEMAAARQLFRGTLDNYWELGPKVVLGRTYGNGSEISAGYEYLYRGYDEEFARDARGGSITNLVRAAFQQEVSVAWKHYWRADRHWRSTTKAGFQRNEDNASGYFDFSRYQLSHQLRYQAKPWEVTLEGRLSYYKFPVQTVSASDLNHRRRADLQITARAERSFGRHLRLSADYAYERADSNLPIDEYAVNMVSAAVSWEF